jgi:sugar (pentulose or hexulose) kinase
MVEVKEIGQKSADAILQRGQGLSQTLSSTGQILGAAMTCATAWTEAKKADQQAESTKMRTRAEDETDFIRAYQENVRAVQEKLAALQQAEADTNRQIVRG